MLVSTTGCTITVNLLLITRLQSPLIKIEGTIYLPCFHFFSALQNRFKHRQKALFTVLVFYICSLQFQIVTNTVRTHYLLSLFSFYSLHFQIVSNTTRTHYLLSLFPFYSLHFQIVSNTTRTHYLLSLFSFYSLHFQIVSNTIRMHHLLSLFSFFSLHFPKSFKIPSERMWMDSLILPSSAKPSPINFNPFYSFKSSLVQSNPAQSSPVQFKLYLIQLNLHKYMLQDLLTLFHLLLPALYQQL